MCHSILYVPKRDSFSHLHDVITAMGPLREVMAASVRTSTGNGHVNTTGLNDTNEGDHSSSNKNRLNGTLKRTRSISPEDIRPVTIEDLGETVTVIRHP